MPKALITGITGQDGSYLAEFLLAKGYEVHGLIRRASTFNTSRIDHLFKDPHETNSHLHLHYGDITDAAGMTNLIHEIAPDEIYNLAAQSHVMVSFTMPTYTANVDGIGTITLLEAIRATGLKTKFYQASTSELFGSTPPPQNELSKFAPRSPYAAAKLYAYWITANYREAYGIHATNGILFNHESPRRGETFVTRKITRSLARIALGLEEVLFLGNIYAKRDWGHARDYVEAMHLILQHNEPDDFVVSTGEAHTVKEFVDLAAESLAIKLEWRGLGADEHAVIKGTNKVAVQIDPLYFRPTDVHSLLGDARKIKSKLGWTPKTSFIEMVNEMAKSDYDQLSKKQK